MSEPEQPFELAYVGSIVPDVAPYNSAPFNRSANLYQAQLLDALNQAGVEPSLILSYTSLVSYPSGSQLWSSAREERDDKGRRIQVLGFANITPLKQIWIGVSAFAHLIEWALIHRDHPRVIHAYNLTTPSGVFLWLAARVTGSKLTVSLCDVNVPGQTVPDTLFFRIDYWMHRILIPRLDGRVVVSEAMAEDFAPDQHYLRLEGGVGEELIARTDGLMNRSVDRAKPFRMVAVGSLNETNGFDLVLDAMSLLDGVDVELDVAGWGPLAERVEAAAKRDPRIRMHGFLTLDAVLDLYRRADLLLVIRRTRTLDTRYFFPGKLFESLLSAIPVLTTEMAGVKKEYGDCLYILDDETPQGLAARIKAIVASSEGSRVEIGQRARARMIATKTWRNQARRLVEYLRHKVLGMRDLSGSFRAV